MTILTPKPATLLLSEFARHTWGERILAAVPAVTLTLLTAEESVAIGGDCPADIAFMTREVTGNSSKGKPSPELQSFEALLRRSPRLRWLQIHPAGAERALYAELRARGVRVTTASGATAVTVAHSAIGALVALNRRFPLLADAQRRHAWEPRLGQASPRDLAGQCAVIVGLGPIGRTIATLARAFGLRTVGIRRKAQAVPECDRTVTYEEIPAVLPAADWLILCCPASPTTRGLVDWRMLGALPAGAHLINVSRGEVAVERDIVDALARGHLAGAYLDVFEREPLDPASPLWDMPNVMISPHTASHSQGQAEAVLRIFLDNLSRWRRGEALRNDVDDLE